MVERIAKWSMAWTALLGVIGAAWLAIPATTPTNQYESALHTRACEMAAGSGWTAVDCSAGAAYSAVLTKNTRYLVQAKGGDPYFTVTTAGAAQDADSNDGYLPEGAWLELRVPDAVRYLCCDGSADSSTIVYVECQ